LALSIAIDTVPERLALAQASGAVTLDFKKEDIYDRFQDLTNGRGADACIDAVGTEPDSGSDFDAVIDRVKVATFMGTDRPPTFAPSHSLLSQLRNSVDRRRIRRPA
jgi:threonine dehydrogenase-like Zn-dependent dehydrogenase